MKIRFGNTEISLVLLAFIFYAQPSFAQSDFQHLPQATDSSYGYTAQNPLRLKKGNQKKSLQHAYQYLAALRTPDGQQLLLISRSTVDNPYYKAPAIQLPNRFDGASPNGKPGFLDACVFITSTTKDTIVLFLDIYNKGSLQIPVGLTYKEAKQ